MKTTYNTCKVNRCEKKIHSKGYCGMHYARIRKHGEEGPPKTTRLMAHSSTCEVEGCDRDYYGLGYCSLHWQRSRLRENGSIADPVSPAGCMMQPCEGEHKGLGLCMQHYSRQDWLKRAYKIDYPTLFLMVENQDGKCKVCKRALSPGKVGKGVTVHIDHDHSCCPGSITCGKCLRGVLCHGCNIGLGAFKDSARDLRAAADYLEQYESRHKAA